MSSGYNFTGSSLPADETLFLLRTTVCACREFQLWIMTSHHVRKLHWNQEIKKKLKSQGIRWLFACSFVQVPQKSRFSQIKICFWKCDSSFSLSAAKALQGFSSSSAEALMVEANSKLAGNASSPESAAAAAALLEKAAHSARSRLMLSAVSYDFHCLLVGTLAMTTVRCSFKSYWPLFFSNELNYRKRR